MGDGFVFSFHRRGGECLLLCGMRRLADTTGYTKGYVFKRQHRTQFIGDYDEETSESRRLECLDYMNELENQFNTLRYQLLMEKKLQTELKLEQIHREDGEMYIKPLECLEEMKRKRLQVASIMRELRQRNIKNKYECESKSAREHLESEKRLVKETLKAELEDKVRKLEEDRDNIDLTAEIWNHNQILKEESKKNASQTLDRKKRPVTVAGPYIVYLLRDEDILDDWTTIMKARGAVARRKADSEVRHDKNHHSVRFVEGKLQYNGKWFHRKDRVLVRVKDESTTNTLCPYSKATITSINSWEVWIKKGNGVKFKVHLSSLEQEDLARRAILHSIMPYGTVIYGQAGWMDAASTSDLLPEKEFLPRFSHHEDGADGWTLPETDEFSDER